MHTPIHSADLFVLPNVSTPFDFYYEDRSGGWYVRFTVYLFFGLEFFIGEVEEDADMSYMIFLFSMAQELSDS